jgi:hypothetical protein
MGEATRVEAAVLLEMIGDAAAHQWMGMLWKRWRGGGGAGVLGRRRRWSIGVGGAWEATALEDWGRQHLGGAAGRAWEAVREPLAGDAGGRPRCGDALRFDAGGWGVTLREDRVGVGSVVEMGREKK